ncbi:uncharacterized protein DSM5745_03071 [Aspergillus mulundensis]|uniref:Fe2OG dioxygenase domain-containing protein n=1 Tax=Aspergillus mulundensis TaxID=1810919 RepID=A0A3D8SJB2_9EURO|nr:Uncharacterized protein DSM5745_03071 [Aspergillus mulundensis]RDW86429.1 Uncharacterized protein DSM5745_03071 [Aspergillus mulundensis]
MPKPRSSKKDTRQPQSQPHQQPPNWPPLRPLVPSSDLHLESLLPDQIYLIRNFLPASLCKTYVSFLASLPLITTPGKPKKGDAVRVNDRFQIQDAAFAENLWRGTALRELVTNPSPIDEDEVGEETSVGRRSMKEIWGGEPLGLNANIRVYRYSPGQFFAQHYDDSNTLSFLSPSTPPKLARTTWTLLIYLSTCTGGETVFYPERTRLNPNPEPIAVAPEMGMALLHRHGDQCLLHEGKEVTDGEKWVLRSDLVVAR